MLRYDQKIHNIRAGRYSRSDFMIADAKDSDMGSGVAGTGFLRNADGTRGRQRTRAEFITAISEVIQQGVVDIMLVSASNLDLLHERGAFRGSDVKPAIRANETSDCWGGVRHGRYTHHASRPFRTAHLPRVMWGTETPQLGTAVTGTDLGLYSVTFNNDLDADVISLNAFADFRRDAASCGFKYFYEIFVPNVEHDMSRDQVGEYMNDCIMRSLAGVSKADRPEFLKMVYNGPKALEELATFDETLIVGILGGGAGTTRDTFELVAQTEKYGGKLVLFGRKINLAESSLDLLNLMRKVADGDIGTDEAVRAYHGELQKQGIVPTRSLEDDRVITEAVLQPAATLKAA